MTISYTILIMKKIESVGERELRVDKSKNYFNNDLKKTEKFKKKTIKITITT